MLKTRLKNKKLSGLKTVVLLLLLSVLLSVLFMPSAPKVDAAENVYNTYGMGPDGRLTRTQAAYDPSKLITVNANKPEDFFVDGERIYISDTLNKAVKVIDFDGRELNNFGLKLEENVLVSDGTFVQPTGIYIRENTLYVADKLGEKVLLMDKNTGAVLKTITRPTHPLFGAQTPFKPSKVVVDTAKNIYLTGEGCPNGVIHINNEGEFQGYLGVNKTPVTFMNLLQSIFFSKDQQSQLLSKTPPSPTNLALDNQNLLYTLTAGSSENSIKKLNTAGTEIRGINSNYAWAMDIDSSLNIYVVESNGMISILDANGWLLFAFGGKDIFDRFGMLKSPSSIRVLENKNILVLDKDLGGIMVYTPTPFFLKAHKATTLSQAGYFMEAEDLWKDILKDNSNLIVGYSTLARANMKRQNYTEALAQFKKAEDFYAYSDALWQVRNEWIQNNSLWMILAVVGLVVVVVALKLVNKYTMVLKPVTGFFGRIKKQKLVSQLLYSGYFFRHPLLAIEQMKYKNKLTMLPAIILFAIYLLVTVGSIFFQGYLWVGNVYNVNIFMNVVMEILPLLLIVVCNYFVSSVTDGEGKFKHVFIAMAYCLLPMIVTIPIFTILTNIFTYNEMIILDAIFVISKIIWVLLMLVSVAGVHGYGFKGIVKNVLLTLFCLAMVVLFAFIIYILFMQQFNFFAALFGEAFV